MNINILTKEGHTTLSDYTYDCQFVIDPMAKPSRIIQKAHISDKHIYGDKDCWREAVCRCSKTGEIRIFFISELTGKKVPDEPPTGASKVIYLQDYVREKRLHQYWN
jgi:hypothetical protein